MATIQVLKSNKGQRCSLGLDVSVSRRSRDVPYVSSRLVSSRMNFPMSRSRLGLEAERLGSRLGLGHEVLSASLSTSVMVMNI